MDGTLAVDQLGLEIKLLARHAVRPFVDTLVDLAFVVERLHERLHRRRVSLFGRADEVVVGDLEVGPHRRPARDHLVGPRLRIHAVLARRALDLLAVLVGSGQEVGPVAAQTVVPGGGIGGDRRIGVTDVRNVVHVVDRRRYVKRIAHLWGESTQRDNPAPRRSMGEA